MSIKEDIANAVQKLQEQRDELKVQMHLASMEAKEDWEELEKKWDTFVSKSKQVQKEAEPALSDISSAVSLLGDEIKEGYQRIRKSL